MTDIAARHVMGHADPDQGCEPVCVCCETLWPCDAELLRRERDEAKQDTFRMGQNWEDALAQRDAAEADAEALAEALRTMLGVLDEPHVLNMSAYHAQIGGGARLRCDDALAAHDARVKEPGR